MNTKYLSTRLVAGAFVLLAAAIATLASCGTSRAAVPSDDYPTTANPEVVESHTSGVISSESRILIRFVQNAAPADKIGGAVAAGIVTTTPPIRGDVVWVDARTIEIKPSAALERGERYRVDVSPDKIDAGRFDVATRFNFYFSVMPQSFVLEGGEFATTESDDIRELVFTATIRSADVAETTAVEKAVTATLGAKALPVEWSHTGVQHKLTIPGILRSDTEQTLALSFRWSVAGGEGTGRATFAVPAQTAFQVLAVTAVDQAERYIEVRFSDSLMRDQDYRGLVSVSPGRELRYTAQNNVLKVTSISDWDDDVSVYVAAEVRNRAGDTLSEPVERAVSFAPLEPQVRYIGNGVILPQKEGVTVPIETVNLNAIIVEIQKIYADNLGQFLQVNELYSAEDLHRVGRTIWKKIVPVPYTEGRRNQWIRTALDLTPLVTDDAHSLYRIILTFDRRAIEYPDSEITDEELLDFPLEYLEITDPQADVRKLPDTFWEQYATHTRAEMDWDRYYDERGDPRKPAYYDGGSYYYGDRERSAARNFLVSDLGLIAQLDASGRLTVAVSNLLTSEPVRNADVSVFDYQLQEIGSVTTDASGIVALTPRGEPFLVVADYDSVKGYLKLMGASNLPVSHFDVTGQEVQQGVKGFLYGERGVWRPGDTIHLTFALWDTNHVLPADHPVSLRLFDPTGRLVRSVRPTESLGSFYHFALPTLPEDPTGTWAAAVLVGGMSFSKELPVETVKPNRLRIALDFGEGVRELTTDGAQGELLVTWLHGAVAADMAADVRVQLSSVPTTFPKYAGYVFDDPVRVFRAEPQAVWEGVLDSRGAATFDLWLAGTPASPGKLLASFRTRVTEPGGNINGDSVALPFHPYTSYVGISIPDAQRDWGWLDVDEPHETRIALVDTTGKPLPRGDVLVQVYEIGWQWWWDRQDNDIADYLGVSEYRLLTSERVEVTGGEATWTLKLDERVWGRFLVRVTDEQSGHATGQIVYFRWPGWYYTSPVEGGDTASMLVFSADKESYAVGETARLSIPSSEAGRALVSIENNGRLISSTWITTRKGQTLHEIPITAAMTPNIYVHVSEVQPHSQTVNDRPIRMFGVIPLSVVDPTSRLKPVLALPEVFEPESNVQISVSEATGRAMTYTLAIVDEGLLNLTRYSTPDPWGHFYRRDASVVSTFDTYGFVAAAYGGRLEKLLAVGGSEEGLAGEGGRKADRFPPMVRYLGPFNLAERKTAKHVVDIPQYVGAVRVMVIAGSGAAWGYADREVPVRKAVMVYGTLPRVASITETLALPVTVFAMEEGARSVEVTVTAQGALSVTGEARRSLRFDAPGDQLATFGLTASARPGLAQVSITARSGSVTSTQTIEMDVRLPNSPVTSVDGLLLKAGESRTTEVKLPGLAGTNGVVVEASRIEPLDLGRRLDFLIYYPHGCIEQTTSAAFPQIYLAKITELAPAEAAQTERNVQAGIARLSLFQTGSGGFSYWPGDTEASDWGTTYATHFLLEAERAGYVVPASLRRAALSYLKTQVSRIGWKTDRNDLVQAYALFDLALAGEPDLGAMNRMRERPSLPAEARFKLAAAYALAGQRQEALRLTEGQIPPLTAYNELGGTYGSDVRDLAILAEGLILSGQIDRATPLVIQVGRALSAGVWYSTQTTAYSLLVVGRYLSLEKDQGPFKLTYEWAGKRATVESGAPVKRVPLETGDLAGTQSLVLTNAAGVPLYIRTIRTGTPAPTEERAASNGLNLTVSYRDTDGRPIDVTSLEQGTDIVARITVSNPTRRGYEELALSYVAPSGWEIANPRFEGWSRDADTGFEYQDIRDDRVHTYFGLGPARSKTLSLMLTASYLGRFYLPQTRVEAMYDASLNAAAQGQWVEVVEQTVAGEPAGR